MLYLSQGKYQWAGEEGTNATLPPNCNAQSAWTVATTTNWASIGWEIIYNPTLAQIQEGDIFTISPSASGIWSGHTGIVYAKHADGTIVTLEQNYNGKRYVQKLYSNNSYYVFNGFSCIVRPKTNSKPNQPKPTPTEKEENMLVIKTEKNYYLITTDGYYTWIADGDVLKALQSKLPTITMNDGRMRGMFVNVSVKKAIDNQQKENTVIKDNIVKLQKDVAELLKRSK
ncbi:endolysin [Lactococcus phage WP-2]|uniref:Peptidase C51 domain-containing protein n=1 Tax=Lactococcus phage WP-2 TaxID=1486423 RepID=A0A024B467_9CAUD|nr:endolysin [Lactococcus phage WP-2]AHZ10873.1 hypothetical protein WP2_01 [Lactococcus phage WP-2]